MRIIRVLIVDDDARFRRFAKRILSNEPDMEVVGEAGDGQEAILKARELKPDVVLMDLRMPGMNGIDATRQMKKEMPVVRVIILTLYDFEEYREAATTAGTVNYILKKSMNGDLIPAIRNAFETKNA